MHVKEAGPTLKVLLRRAQDEQMENIKRAQHNALAFRPEQKVPYESRAFRDLIKGVSGLLDLVQGQSGG